MNRKGISTVAVVVIVVVAVVVAAVGTYFALREEKEPANLGVADIDVPQVQQGETATVEVLITNSGGKEG
ncbi:hypothetical protein AKJ62_00380, partial [candidate division MSBL1 archaeon SCGC-AAA259D14]